MTTIDAWYEKLTDSPDVWEIRLIFADWLEDQGELVLVAGQRWQAANRRCPYISTDQIWYWFCVQDAEFKSRRRFHPESDLYAALYDRLANGKITVYNSFHSYSCLQQAEADLAQVLAKLQECSPHLDKTGSSHDSTSLDNH